VKAELRETLAGIKKQTIKEPLRVPSAVLIPVYETNGRYHIVFIRRTRTVKNHKGQISFPGGVREDYDSSMMDTALRESYEEIGLLPEDAEVIGELDDEITTTSNYIVTPFVALIPHPYRFIPSEDEVDEIIEVPILSLLDKDCLKPDIEVLNGEEVPSFAYHYQGKIIWGATARILNKFLGIIGGCIPQG
jgi:8-oxo-dGTP pyrophosphatase MutT (NUDIX family)